MKNVLCYFTLLLGRCFAMKPPTSVQRCSEAKLAIWSQDSNSLLAAIFHVSSERNCPSRNRNHRRPEHPALPQPDLEQMYQGPPTRRMKKSVWTTVSGVYHGRSRRDTDGAEVEVDAQANVEFYRSRERILGEARRQSQNLPNLWGFFRMKGICERVAKKGDYRNCFRPPSTTLNPLL